MQVFLDCQGPLTLLAASQPATYLSAMVSSPSKWQHKHQRQKYDPVLCMTLSLRWHKTPGYSTCAIVASVAEHWHSAAVLLADRALSMCVCACVAEQEEVQNAEGAPGPQAPDSGALTVPIPAPAQVRPNQSHSAAVSGKVGLRKVVVAGCGS